MYLISILTHIWLSFNFKHYVASAIYVGQISMYVSTYIYDKAICCKTKKKCPAIPSAVAAKLKKYIIGVPTNIYYNRWTGPFKNRVVFFFLSPSDEVLCVAYEIFTF